MPPSQFQSVTPPREGGVDISVLVPAHNEERTIQVCIDRAARALSARNLRFEIIAIDDGSTDATRQRALEFARSSGSVRVMRIESRIGKGAALVAAARVARGQTIVVLDADLEYAPEEALMVIEPILRGMTDVVFGSRFLGETNGMSFSNWLGNQILTRTTNLLYKANLTDVMTGYKAFATTTLHRLQIGATGFGFEVEVAAKAITQGIRIVEVPISYRRRFQGKSKIRKLGDGIRCLLRLIELAHHRKAA